MDTNKDTKGWLIPLRECVLTLSLSIKECPPG